MVELECQMVCKCSAPGMARAGCQNFIPSRQPRRGVYQTEEGVLRQNVGLPLSPLSFPQKPKAGVSRMADQVADHLVPNQVLGFFEFFTKGELRVSRIPPDE